MKKEMKTVEKLLKLVLVIMFALVNFIPHQAFTASITSYEDLEAVNSELIEEEQYPVIYELEKIEEIEEIEAMEAMEAIEAIEEELELELEVELDLPPIYLEANEVDNYIGITASNSIVAFNNYPHGTVFLSDYAIFSQLAAVQEISGTTNILFVSDGAGGVLPAIFMAMGQVAGLPPGMTLSGGNLTGRPTAAGVFNATVQFFYDGSWHTRPVQITVPPLADYTIQLSPHVDFVLNEAVPAGTTVRIFNPDDVMVPHTGTWSATGLPAGLSLSTAGVLSGTPTAEGTSNVTFTNARGATAGGNVSRTMSITVAYDGDYRILSSHNFGAPSLEAVANPHLHLPIPTNPVLWPQMVITDSRINTALPIYRFSVVETGTTTPLEGVVWEVRSSFGSVGRPAIVGTYLDSSNIFNMSVLSQEGGTGTLQVLAHLPSGEVLSTPVLVFMIVSAPDLQLQNYIHLTSVSINDGIVNELFHEELELEFYFNHPIFSNTPLDFGMSNPFNVPTVPQISSITNLPAGLSINNITRMVTGTPTVTGTFNMDVVVNNPFSSNFQPLLHGSTQLTIQSTDPIFIYPTPVDGTELGPIFEAFGPETIMTAAVDGIPLPEMSLEQSGSHPLPDWLAFDPDTGEVTANPPAGSAGTHHFRIRAENISDYIYYDFSVVVEEFDNTQPGEEPDPTDPRWVNITIPTAVLFQSYVDADGYYTLDLVSPTYHIINNSYQGVEISVIEFEHTNTADIDMIVELDLVASDGYDNHTVRVISNGNTAITSHQDFIRLGSGYHGDDDQATFKFAGAIDDLLDQASFPRFRLVLRFEAIECPINS